MAQGPNDDWLSMSTGDLEAMHAESLDRLVPPVSPAKAARSAASFAVLHQVILARVVVVALGMPADEARAAMQSSYVLGYLFGLASGCGDGAEAGPSDQRIASALMMLHDLVYGRDAAERMTADLLGGKQGVDDAFADGILAAGADMADLTRWRDGTGGSLPCRMLDGLHQASWRREAMGDRQH